ncbi:hypothetical protein FQA39_LY13414 [Lamprigera yunnana]|nr:hypothetical protein FQA39_LY13414 [Lamprigera yunnana]
MLLNQPEYKLKSQLQQITLVHYKYVKNYSPLLRPNAQVVNMSSVLGHLAYIPSSTLRSKFSTPDLTIPQLSQLMNDFINDAENGKNVENGWGKSSYIISKVGLSALTNIQQREFDKEELNKNISVNSVQPGYVVADMTRTQGCTDC